MPTKATGKSAAKSGSGRTKKNGSEQKLHDAEARVRELEASQHSAPGGSTATAQGGSASEILADGLKKLRCPRCAGAMTEYQHEVVRADRCDECHGIFFDNGELEQVVEKVTKDQAAVRRGWFTSLFGRREKTVRS